MDRITIRTTDAVTARHEASQKLGPVTHISTVYRVRGEPTLRDYTFVTNLIG